MLTEIWRLYLNKAIEYLQYSVPTNLLLLHRFVCSSDLINSDDRRFWLKLTLFSFCSCYNILPFKEFEWYMYLQTSEFCKRKGWTPKIKFSFHQTSLLISGARDPWRLVLPSKTEVKKDLRILAFSLAFQ